MNNEQLLNEFIQKVQNEKDFDSITNYVAPAYTVFMDPSDPWEGRTLNYEVFAMRLGYTFDAFPDIKFELQTAISEGDHVTTTWMMTCNNRGKNGAVSLTNKIIRTLGLTIYHFADDKICGHTQVVDRRTSMKKLGFLSESVDENLKGYAINTIITS